MKYIQELREGERLSQIFFCKNKTIATTKAGKTYYSLTLQDKTGVLDGKVWELSGAIEHFENLDFIPAGLQIQEKGGGILRILGRHRAAAAQPQKQGQEQNTDAGSSHPFVPVFHRHSSPPGWKNGCCKASFAAASFSIPAFSTFFGLAAPP